MTGVPGVVPANPADVHMIVCCGIETATTRDFGKNRDVDGGTSMTEYIRNF